MSTVTVIGTGNMGTAIAGVMQKAGADLQILDPDRAKAAELAGQVGGTPGIVGDEIAGDVVVLAVPYPALGDLAAHKEQFTGKVVVDITNPVDFETFDRLVVPADSSAAAEVAAQLPGAHVVKAFNTTFAGVLSSGKLGGNDAVVLVANDDSRTKETLIGLVDAAGLKGIDAGSLKRAREMEALAFLQMALAANETITWTGGFALVK